jgi:hypothetical protein
VVQPLVDSVRTVGEVSVFVIGGRAVSRVDKHPDAGEVRSTKSTARAPCGPTSTP